MPDVISFEAALEESKAPGRRVVLLGNGFSIARGGDDFLYSNLFEKSDLPGDSPIRKAFQRLETLDFEAVMKALEDASKIELAYGDVAKAKQFGDDAAKVREALINAIRKVHPGVHFEIPKEQSDACGKFLMHFAKIFTLNYDLLLYWVILRATEGFQDGFSRGDEVGGFRTFSKVGAVCNTYYLHGALHLFLDQKRNTLKRVLTGSTIINDIAETIRTRSQPPLIAAEGTAAQKIGKIKSVPYLDHCYETFEELNSSLIIFGHSVSDSDTHIYDAVCRSRLNKVFFCVHKPNQRLKEMRERLARYTERNRDIKWFYVDAATANVWGR